VDVSGKKGSAINKVAGGALKEPSFEGNFRRLPAQLNEDTYMESTQMPAYFIVQSTIKDDAQFQKYRQAVVPFIAGFGGKLVARGAKVEVFEGEP